MTSIRAAALAVILCAGAAQGQITAWLDDTTGFDARLDQLTDPVFGVPGRLTAPERVTLKNGILNTLVNAYNFAGVQWAFGWGARPALAQDESIDFGQQIAAYGDAERVDWRNPKKRGNARISFPTFGSVLTAINGQAIPRAQKIDQLAVAVGNTVAHELGHNLGLDHRDCYATPGVDQTTWAATGGLQKNHIMASGPSGLGDNLDRVTVRTFNEWERAKLGYADGLSTAVPASRDEGVAGDAGNTLAAATAITFLPVPTSPLLTRNLIATMPAGDQDWVKFPATQGTPLIADILSQELRYDNRLANPIDAKLELWRDNGGAPILLFSNDDFRFLSNVAYSGAAQAEASLDSYILRYILPANDTYYLGTSLAAAGGSNYELFISVPEPGVLALLGVGLSRSRRRRA